jgi:hypothetical protein
MIISLLLIPLIGVLMLLPLGYAHDKDQKSDNLKNIATLGYLSTLQRLSSQNTISSINKNEEETSIKTYTTALNNYTQSTNNKDLVQEQEKEIMKKIALFVSLLNLLISIYMWFQFDYNTTSYQFVYEFNQLSFCHFHVGVDGISLYFVLLTTFITPICILSN